jgi:hypothetical protein
MVRLGGDWPPRAPGLMFSSARRPYADVTIFRGMWPAAPRRPCAQHAMARTGRALPVEGRGRPTGAGWLGAGLGLGRTVALYYRSSTLYHIREHIRCLYF